MLLNANAAGDYLTAKLAASNDAAIPYNEAVDAKQEMIIKTISEGGEVDGFDIAYAVGMVLDGPPMKDADAALIAGYRTDNFDPFKALVDKEINRIAEMLAPGMVDAELERHPGAA